jgi:O-acetyl-ADP-ribose deacetylase (regulator of RNase III)
MEETRRRYPNGCPTGSAVITAGGNLPAKFVIHAVGPVWNDGRRGEEDILMAAYRTSLQLAADHACQSVALPALSTGAYRYPIDKAARAAVRAAAQFLRELPGTRPLATVQFVLFSEEALQAFERALRAESGPAVETRPR